MSCSEASANAASSSSIFDMAKPTWMSTQSPGTRPSSSRSPMLTMRVTPDTSTRARWGLVSVISLSCPGMPRHMVVASLVSLVRLVFVPHGHDVDADVHLGLDLEHEHLGGLHAEFPDVEARRPREADRLIVESVDAQQVLVVALDAPERHVAAHPVRVVGSVARHLVELALYARVALGVYPLLHLAVLHPVAPLQLVHGQRELAGGRRGQVEGAARLEGEVDVPFQAGRGGMDRMDGRARGDATPLP